MDKLKLYKVEALYGSVEPRAFSKFEDGKMITYSYSIYRDIRGMEYRRTVPCPISSIEWACGAPFSSTDYENIKNNKYGLKRIGILRKLWNFLFK